MQPVHGKLPVRTLSASIDNLADPIGTTCENVQLQGLSSPAF